MAEEIGLAWPRLLSALAPAVVVIEDLHWAEPPLLDLVEAIVGRCDGPLLLVATARRSWPRPGRAGATGRGCRRSCSRR